MKSWGIALIALIAVTSAVLASVFIPRIDRTHEVRPATSPAALEPAFTAVDDDPTPSPTPSGSPGLVRAGDRPDGSTPPSVGFGRASVEAGEIAEDSTDQDAEEEEQDRELEEEEARADAREERARERARNQDD